MAPYDARRQRSPEEEHFRVLKKSRYDTHGDKSPKSWLKESEANVDFAQPGQNRFDQVQSSSPGFKGESGDTDSKLDFTTSDGHDLYDPDDFTAAIEINKQIIGGLTPRGIKLDPSAVALGILGTDNSEVSVRKTGKRLLRIEGSDGGRDDYVLTLPNSKCDLIAIEVTDQGCRASADGRVFFQKLKHGAKGESLQSLEATIDKINTEHKTEVERIDSEATDSEWYKLYLEWREWTTSCLVDRANMKKFPSMPNRIRRCKMHDCSRRLPDGEPRAMRYIRPCRHDIEMWFRDAAGGYNDAYYRILKYEVVKWLPSKFVLSKDKTKHELQMEFKNRSGEMWKNAEALIDKYERDGGGFIPTK